MTTTIGILALQGSVEEHAKMIEKCGAIAKEIRNPKELDGISGIIFPGGESTAIGKLLDKNNLREPLIKKITEGLPAWGTCAGAILLAQNGSEYSLKVGDFDVERNAYGSQIDSFETPLNINIPLIKGGLGDLKNFPAIFIRAPKFTRVGQDVEILSEYQGTPVFVRDKNIWASTFHPELANDEGVHKAFIKFSCSIN